MIAKFIHTYLAVALHYLDTRDFNHMVTDFVHSCLLQ